MKNSRRKSPRLIDAFALVQEQLTKAKEDAAALLEENARLGRALVELAQANAQLKTQISLRIEVQELSTSQLRIAS